MIIRFRSRKKKRRSSRNRDAHSYTFRFWTYFVACLGTLYFVTERHCLDDRARMTAETLLLHLPHLRSRGQIIIAEETSSSSPKTAFATTAIAAENAIATDDETVQQQPIDEPAHPQAGVVNSTRRIRDTLFQIGTRITPEAVWDSLLEEGKALLASSANKNVIAMEVGMYRALQCLNAAKAGLTAHCVEPSPRNFGRVVHVVNQQPPEIKNRIHLYQKAAGAVSGLMLNFSAGGGTGDHVGEFDPWNMKIGKTTDEELKSKLGPTIQIPSIAMDDIIQDALPSQEERVFVLKIDTQGYEPSVFAGLNASVFEQQRIDFILFEYWPKGMDLLASTGEDGSDVTKACIAANLLERLQDAGYTLYALPDTSHPQAPRPAKGALRERAPLDNPKVNCAYYYQLEERFPSPTYKMGYWSDILAVASNASLVANPVTKVGQALQQERQQQQEPVGNTTEATFPHSFSTLGQANETSSLAA